MFSCSDNMNAFRCIIPTTTLPTYIQEVCDENSPTTSYFCTKCTNLRNPIKDVMSLCSHIQKYHRYRHDYIKYHEGRTFAENKCDLTFSTPKQTTYHKYNRNGFGNKYLVFMSSFNNSHHDVLDKIP